MAAAAAMESVDSMHPLADPQQQSFDVDAAQWWSPGMQMGPTTDEQEYQGTYSYGNEDFY